eukprot:ANDGO_07448.mRNA.1 hypothetical protein
MNSIVDFGDIDAAVHSVLHLLQTDPQNARLAAVPLRIRTDYRFVASLFTSAPRFLEEVFEIPCALFPQLPTSQNAEAADSVIFLLRHSPRYEERALTFLDETALPDLEWQRIDPCILAYMPGVLGNVRLLEMVMCSRQFPTAHILFLLKRSFERFPEQTAALLIEESDCGLLFHFHQTICNAIAQGRITEVRIRQIPFVGAEIILALSVCCPALLQASMPSFQSAMQRMHLPRPWVWLVRASILARSDEDLLHVAELLLEHFSTRGVRLYFLFNAFNMSNVALAQWMIKHCLMDAERIFATSSFPNVLQVTMPPDKLFSMQEMIALLDRILANPFVIASDALCFAASLSPRLLEAKGVRVAFFVDNWMDSTSPPRLDALSALLDVTVSDLILSDEEVEKLVHISIRNEETVRLETLAQGFRADLSDPKYWSSISSLGMLQFLTEELGVHVRWPTWMKVPAALRKSIRDGEQSVHADTYEACAVDHSCAAAGGHRPRGG